MLHDLGEAVAAGAMVRALLEARGCSNVLPADCSAAKFWQSSAIHRHVASTDDDSDLLAAAAPISLAGYTKTRLRIGNPMAPTEVCTYQAGVAGTPRVTLVFEPGLGSHTGGMCSVLSAVLEKLDAAGLGTVYRAVCYDRIGTGESSWPPPLPEGKERTAGDASTHFN